MLHFSRRSSFFFRISFLLIIRLIFPEPVNGGRFVTFSIECRDVRKEGREKDGDKKGDRKKIMPVTVIKSWLASKQ